MLAKRKEYLVSVEDAVSMINDGDTIGLGGLVLTNTPMAMVRAIIKKGLKNLTVVSGASSGLETDMLIGAGCVKKVVTSYVGLERFCPIGPNYRQALEKGLIQLWECDEGIWHAALKAACYGLPYILWKGGIGSDLLKANPDLEEEEIRGEKWVRVPPIAIDIAILQAGRADIYGNVQHMGGVFSDKILARAARKAVIVSVEQIIPNELIRADPRLTTITDAYIVKLPYGAHPCANHGYYMYDEEHLAEYVQAAEQTRKGTDPSAFQKYLDNYILTISSHEDYLEKIGGIKRLLKLHYY
jgi:glutaconate CoA-transferase subunit A